jgi:hypothetical protein
MFTNTSGGAIPDDDWYLDGSANCFINRISTNSQDSPLEDFNRCNVYIPVVYDLTTDPLTRNTFFSFFGNNSTAAATIANCRLGYDVREDADIGNNNG